MKNTKINYLYRDGANYKTPNSVIIKGEVTKEQINGILSCCSWEYFIPEQVGLPADRGEDYRELDPEYDHCWFELYEDGFELVDKSPTENITVEELVKAFQKSKGKWDDVHYPEELYGR